MLQQGDTTKHLEFSAGFISVLISKMLISILKPELAAVLKEFFGRAASDDHDMCAQIFRKGTI